MTLALPVDVGSVKTQPAALSSAESLTKKSGDLTVTLTYDGVLKAGQPSIINFDAVDAQNNPVDGEVGLSSGSHLVLNIIDAELKTFLRTELTDTNNLLFSVTFPKPGKYKVWFEYNYARQAQQLSFVIDVK